MYIFVAHQQHYTASDFGLECLLKSQKVYSFSISSCLFFLDPDFDPDAGRLWIYPTNMPVRDYQFNIVKQCLYKNTLVVLPTGKNYTFYDELFCPVEIKLPFSGLGKTFIAAVVMFNFYRWYPLGKIVFMAPTKPLVAQQIEACYNIMGIPQSDTAEMTGAMQPSERKRCWKEKRVFFLTPQVLMNDLSRSAIPAEHIKCVVVDEAHKALGNHAYCQVVKEISQTSQAFRVVALSATPGTDIKVQSNLMIQCTTVKLCQCCFDVVRTKSVVQSVDRSRRAAIRGEHRHSAVHARTKSRQGCRSNGPRTETDSGKAAAGF